MTQYLKHERAKLDTHAAPYSIRTTNLEEVNNVVDIKKDEKINMYWEVMLPGDKQGKLGTSFTIEADNWFSALRNGLTKHGMDGQTISNLTCDIKPDKSVYVTDFVTRKVYMLKPLGETKPDSQPVDKTEPAFATESKAASEVSDTSGDLPSHMVFFSRDEAPNDGSAIFYRERLVAVDKSTDKDTAARISSAIFDQLKARGSNPETKLFISVQVFDHEFKERSQRPAIAALTWKEWSPKKTKIQFPLSGETGINLSRVPSAPFASVSKSKSKPTPVKEAPQEIKKKASPAKTKKTTSISKNSVDLVTEDAVVVAFEKMQDIYSVRKHDDAALFALNLSRDFIPCEAGSAMLITPGKYELYIAAAQGELADQLKDKRLSLTKGIVGFAARTGAVITVSDPENDPRFDNELDLASGFKTRSVVCSPIQYEGKVIGAIELINSSRENGFTQSEANVLSYIAGAVGEYIDTSLPSREADFNDREFAEFLPSTTKESPQKSSLKKPASKKEPSARINPKPSAKLKPSKAKVATSPKSKKKKKKRNR